MKTQEDRTQVRRRQNGNRDYAIARVKINQVTGGRAVNYGCVGVKGAIKITQSYFCSVYFTVAICSVTGILQLFLKQTHSVCTTEQQQTSEKRAASRSNTSKCTIKKWDVQLPTYKQLSNKRAYDQIQENCLLCTCVQVKYLQNISVSSIQELLGTTVNSILKNQKENPKSVPLMHFLILYLGNAFLKHQWENSQHSFVEYNLKML